MIKPNNKKSENKLEDKSNRLLNHYRKIKKLIKKLKKL
jgi:hypothetical protein